MNSKCYTVLQNLVHKKCLILTSDVAGDFDVLALIFWKISMISREMTYILNIGSVEQTKDIPAVFS